MYPFSDRTRAGSRVRFSFPLSHSPPNTLPAEKEQQSSFQGRKEYTTSERMNDMNIGIDHGYYAIKTRHFSFPAGISAYAAAFLSKDDLSCDAASCELAEEYFDTDII